MQTKVMNLQEYQHHQEVTPIKETKHLVLQNQEIMRQEKCQVKEVIQADKEKCQAQEETPVDKEKCQVKEATRKEVTMVEKVTEEVKFDIYSFVVEKRHCLGNVFLFLKIIDY